MTPSQPVAARAARARLRFVVAALSILSILAISRDPSATTIARMSLRQIVDASDTIVQARVEKVRSFWEGKQILTEVTLGVSQSFKGSPGASLTFRQLGGRVDWPVPIETTVPGAPAHRVGDEGFYFLQAGGSPGRTVIVGLSRGLVPVRRDPAGAYVAFEGARRAPSDFAEEIRRLVTGQERGPGETAKVP